MTRSLRTRHLIMWLVVAPIALAILIAAIVTRPTSPGAAVSPEPKGAP